MTADDNSAMTDDLPDVPRRSFVALATATYTDSSLPVLDRVADDVQIFTDWLCDEHLGTRRFSPVYPELAQNPTMRQVEDALTRLEQLMDGGDAAVVLVSGHGLQAEDGHWIALHDTNPSDLQRTAVSIEDLIGRLRTCPADHVMVILDLRFTTPAAYDTVRLPPLPPTWIVLAGASPPGAAVTGGLAAAVRGFLDELRTREGERFDHGPYLRADQFREAVAARVPGQRLHFLHAAAPSDGFSICLPNPRHRAASELVEPARRDLAIRPEDLMAHWEPKARGSDAGWMFTGRAVVMERLIGFLRKKPSALVVTGAAGTGKSAVLSRLVILTDRRFRADHPELINAVPPDLQPDVGAVDVAVLATGKSSEALFEQILEALEVAVDDEVRPTLASLTERWNSWISAHPGPLTIVIDALDEAKNPKTLLDEVVFPIARKSAPGSVRLIVGVRGPSSDDSLDPSPVREGGKAFPDHVVDELRAQRLDVDKEPLWRTADLAEFATDVLLRTPGSPYAAGHDELVRRVAGVIAERTRPSFLVARLAANNLASAPAVIDPNDSDWLRSLDEGLVGVFRDDLRSARPDPADRLNALHLLRAVAFAKGRGLPWSQMWPLVANAVADHPLRYGDSDVARLLASRLNGYLVTDHEDGYVVYRLFHDALRTTLRERWGELLDHGG